MWRMSWSDVRSVRREREARRVMCDCMRFTWGACDSCVLQAIHVLVHEFDVLVQAIHVGRLEQAHKPAIRLV